MKVTETHLKSCFIVEPQVFADEIGKILLGYNKKEFLR